MNRLLDEFWSLAEVPQPVVDIVGAEHVLPSRLATGELAVGAVAAAAGAAAHLAQARGAPQIAARVDGRRVSAAFRSDRLFRLDGAAVDGFAELSGFWRTADGWVRTHANYPHHRARLLTALDLGADSGRDRLAARLEQLRGDDVEAAVTAEGGVAVVVRTPAQWRAHPQDSAVRSLPLVGRHRLGDGAPRALAAVPRAPMLPAAGLRVLDLTRVIAGPVATRTLALLGADVLRVDSPRLPEIGWQHLDTGLGKRSTLIDLATQRDTFDRLLDHADVVVIGYRPHAVDRFGLAPAELAARRPGLVVATLSAWGPTGPWGPRRGFDSIVQAASGIALVESPDGQSPGALPAQALDHATGYLLAAAILQAVAAQLAEGGSLHVHAHLARTAAWLVDHVDGSVGTVPEVDDLLVERATRSGVMRYPGPAFELAGGPQDWTTAGMPWGADEAVWSAAAT